MKEAQRVNACLRDGVPHKLDQSMEDLRADVTASLASKYCVAVSDIFTVRGTCGWRAACFSTCTRHAAGSVGVGPFSLNLSKGSRDGLRRKSGPGGAATAGSQFAHLSSPGTKQPLRLRLDDGRTE